MSVSGSESTEDGQSLVQVRAQVMTRDDSSGGWVPLEGGGLSNVSVKRSTPDKRDYVIYGKRISDQSTVLHCTIKRDFEYNKVMPTFHHWKTGNKKFGLTFQTAADSRAFDKGVRSAVDDINLHDGNNGQPFQIIRTDTGEDDVFMALDLPIERQSSSSTSSRASVGGSSVPLPPTHMHKMYFSNKPSSSGIREPTRSSEEESTSAGASCYQNEVDLKDKIYSEKDLHREDVYSSYVQFQRGGSHPSHEYSYPVVPETQIKYTPTVKSNIVITTQPKKSIALDPLQLPEPPLLPSKNLDGSVKKKRICGKKRRCADCHEVYSEDCNPRGSCDNGPDPIRSGIETISCLCCAKGMFYHCLSGAEGEVASHPCAFEHHRCKRRWLALTLLSFVVPCLCLYPPLIGCHKVAKHCHLCGARHHPS